MKVCAYIAIASLSILLAITTNSAKLAAQEQIDTIIAVVQGQLVLRESFASKSIQNQIEMRRNQYQTEISAEEKILREREKELLHQQSVLSPEAFAKYRSDFENDVTTVQRMVAERRGELDRAYAKGIKIIQRQVSEILKEISFERNISLIVPVSQTLFFDQKLNISREVLKRLNSRLPDLTLEFEPK